MLSPLLHVGILLVSFIGLCFGTSSGSTFPRYQLEALEALYNSTNGDHWAWRVNNSNVSHHNSVPLLLGKELPDQHNVHIGVPWNFTANANPCVDKWQGILCNGTGVCDELNAWNCNVTDITLIRHNLTGTIPSELYTITTLEGLDFSDNNLYGTIPSGLGLLSSLTHLAFAKNHIVGSFPTSMFDCRSLRSIVTEYNALTGPLPVQLGTLSSLSALGVGFNSFFGTLPSSLGMLSKLHWLDVQQNCFSGTIPASIGYLTDVTGLDCGANHFTGSFPSAVSGVPNSLLVVDVSYNLLDSDINWVLTYPGLLGLFLNDNCFSGTIPQSINIAPGLIDVLLNGNRLTGSFPSTLGYLPALRDLIVFDNMLSGSFPSTLGGMEMHDLLVHNNFLTGSWAFLVDRSNSFQKLNVGVNMFTGTLSSGICLSTSLFELRMDSNSMTGTIPSCIGALNALTMFDMSHNSFSGTLPSGMVNLRNLTTFLVTDNALSGSISSSLPVGALMTVDVSENGFSGLLPYSVFTDQLEAFIAVKSCFYGSISSEICASTRLKTLDISGLTAGSSCSAPLNLLGLSFYFASTITGTLPSCISELPLLTQYYVAGNGIKSSLSHFSRGESLVNVSLSNNRLIGAIPVSLQESISSFLLLDMSFNHIGGTIEQMIIGTEAEIEGSASNRTLLFKSNRLSGVIPAAFVDSPVHMNILIGNLFQCDSSLQLPESDPNHSRYVCGSGVANPLWVTYACILVASMLIVAYFARFGSFAVRLRHELNILLQYCVWSPSDRSGNTTVDHLANILSRYRTIFAMVGLVIGGVFMPLFVALKRADGADYSTHVHQYGWIVSMAFLHHDVTAITVTALWLGVLCALVTYEVFSSSSAGSGAKPLVRVDAQTLRTDSRDPTPFSPLSASQNRQRYLCIGALLVCNTAVVLVFNGVFVYIALSQSLLAIRCFTVIVVVFKLTWNFAVILPRLTALDCKFVVLLGVMIFNNILAPVLATMAVDVSCFQELFVPASPIVNSYSYESCDTKDTIANDVLKTCVSYVTNFNSVSFVPPFIYGGQCSSSIVQVYVPVFVLSYGLVGIIVPITQFAVMRYFATATATATATEASKSPYVTELLRNIKSNIRLISQLTNNVVTDMVLPIESLDDLKDFMHYDEPESHCEQSKPVSGSLSLSSKPLLLYRSSQFAMNNLMILVLLVTFGLAYPPLALMLVINVTVTSLVLQSCIHAHYTQLAGVEALAAVSARWQAMLASEFRYFHDILFGSRSFILFSSSAFLSLFLYDMTGTAKPRMATGLIVVLIALPYAHRLACRYYVLHYSSSSRQSIDIDSDTDTDAGADADGDTDTEAVRGLIEIVVLPTKRSDVEIKDDIIVDHDVVYITDANPIDETVLGGTPDEVLSERETDITNPMHTS